MKILILILSFSFTSGFKLFDSSSWDPFGSSDEPKDSKATESTEESLPESDPFFDDDFFDDWDGNDLDDVEKSEEESAEEDVENFSEGGEGFENESEDHINTKPTSLNWKWEDFGWGGIGSADNDDDSDDEDIFDSAGEGDENESLTTDGNDLIESTLFENLQGRSGMKGGRSFVGFADFANQLGLAGDTADKLRPNEDNDPDIEEIDNKNQDDETDEVEDQEDSVIVVPLETEEGEKNENGDDQKPEDDGDFTSDEEDEDDDDDDGDSSDEEDTENHNSDENTDDAEIGDENEGEETFVTPGPEEEGTEEQAEKDDEEPKEDSNNLDSDFDDSRHDSKDPEVYPTISTTEKTTKTTTATTIATTTIATTQLASRVPIQLVTTTEEPTTTTKKITTTEATTTSVDIQQIWDKDQCEGLVHGLKMHMAAGRCYTVFDHVPHGVTARMAYKKCRGYTSNGGRPLTLLGLTRFNNQEEVIEALRDVVIGENGCGGFWTTAKNAPIRRQSNRANSSNAVLYNGNNMQYTNANIEFVSDQTKMMMRQNGVEPCQNDSGYSEFDDYNYLQVICFYAF